MTPLNSLNQGAAQEPCKREGGRPVSLAEAATSIVFVAAKLCYICRANRVFVATKMILVAAPANDTPGLPSLIVRTVSVYVKQTPKKKKKS